MPLGLCDARNVAQKELKDTLIINPSETAGMERCEGYHVIHSAAHRWYYLAAMQPDEPWVFNQFDSDSTRTQWAVHAAFDDPTSAPGAAPRARIEVRTLAFLPD